MAEPLISVITCTKNSERFLKYSLESVENQTYRNIEHVFIDGFSTDKTLKILNTYIKKNKNIKTKLVKSEPRGIANALNIGFENSTGDIIHYLHSDDFYCDKNSLKRVVQYFSKHPKKEWLTGDALLMYKEKIIEVPLSKFQKKFLKKIITFYNFISHENTFVKRKFLKKYGPFNEKNRVTVEYGIWLKAFKETEPLVVNDKFTVYIIHRNSASSHPFGFIRGNIEQIKTWGEVKRIPILGYYEDSEIYKNYNRVKSYLRKLSENGLN